MTTARKRLWTLICSLQLVVIVVVLCRTSPKFGRNYSETANITTDRIPKTDETELGKSGLVDLPWQLLNVLRTVPRVENVESVSVDVELFDNVADSPNLFIVPINSYINQRQFYFGAMTSISAVRRGEALRNDLPRGFMFRRWGDQDLAAIRPNNDGYHCASGHEGDLVDVSALFPWGKGRYTFTLELMERQVIDAAWYVWVGQYVYCHKTNERCFVGALRFPGRTITFDGQMVSFVEIYNLNPKARPATVPPVRVAIGDVRINGKIQTPSFVTIHYRDGVPVWARTDGRNGEGKASSDLRKAFPNDEGGFLITVEKGVVPNRNNEQLFP